MSGANTRGGGQGRTIADLSRRAMGAAALAFCALLMLMLGYLLVVVVRPMTRPTPFFQELTRQYSRQLDEAEAGGPGEVDETTVDLAIILEYASADIRTAGVQISFALVSGLFFSGIGVLLFSAGVSGALDLSGNRGRTRFSLTTAAPGIVCILLGAVIISFGVLKDVSRSLAAEVRRGLDVRLEARQEETTPATEGLPPRPGLDEDAAAGPAADGAGTPSV
ncbi:hypothetical protein [Tautonia plasticadhaerens]|uniref:Uncharacterized protein n=1 Tax=Tautonia plasticadhaerens TaxID=2527974 RepID=A0A518H119_9BACT|nr:hypothetical protein [Tautonia plasticadhaerens]QDV34518.1 hypothetical protein ElP_24080 [Tautonia plasticadhaerens]